MKMKKKGEEEGEEKRGRRKIKEYKSENKK